MIELDGSFGEGGGQILRTSLALSLITKKPFHLKNVRTKRAKPGLQPQHLMSVQAAATIGQARLRGASLHSTDLTFEPGEVVPGNYHFRIGTAGNTGLVLHTIYLPLALAPGPSMVTIEGGTHVKQSPCYHFLETTWKPYMEHLGIKFALRMLRSGFYPRGGGLIEAAFEGNAQLPGLNLQIQKKHQEILIRSAVARLPENIAQRQADRAFFRLRSLKRPATIRLESWDGGPGTMLGLEIPTEPAATLFFSLGERGKPAERVADEAVDQALPFLEASQEGVDLHSSDQLLLPLSLAQGQSRYEVTEITQHLLTNATVIRRFLDKKIACEGEEGASGSVILS